MGSHALLQWIFWTQRLNLSLLHFLHWQAGSLPPAPPGKSYVVAVVQSLSRVWLFATPWTATHQASLSFTISQSLLKLISIELMPSNHLILCHPLLLLFSICPNIRVFSHESALCIRWEALQFSSVQFSHVRLLAIPWIAARQASLSITNSRSSPKLMSIKSVMPSSHLILCHHLLLLPPILPSIRVFSNESTLHIRWPNIGVSAAASVLPKNTQDWSPLGWTGWVSLQSETLKSLLQHHSSKASILLCSAFFIVQLSHPYMTTGKNYNLD